METKIKFKDFYKECGYKDTDLLMNPATGSVDTAKNWSDEMIDWDTEDESAEEQFSQLIHVEKAFDGWTEI